MVFGVWVLVCLGLLVGFLWLIGWVFVVCLGGLDGWFVVCVCSCLDGCICEFCFKLWLIVVCIVYSLFLLLLLMELT